jgi:hypothetical protein
VASTSQPARVRRVASPTMSCFSITFTAFVNAAFRESRRGCRFTAGAPYFGGCKSP